MHRQQLRYLNQHQGNRTPLEALVDDLQLEIQQFQNNGDQIILMGDFNDHVREPTISNSAELLNLQEATTQQHSEAQGFVST